MWLAFGDAIMWVLFIDDELFIECIAAGLAEGEADAMAAARRMFNIPQLRRAAARG
jgi:hypothetical protein